MTPRISPKERAHITQRLDELIAKPPTRGTCLAMWNEISEGNAPDARLLARAIRAWDEPLPDSVRTYVAELIVEARGPMTHAAGVYSQMWEQLGQEVWPKYVVSRIRYWQDVFTKEFPNRKIGNETETAEEG